MLISYALEKCSRLSSLGFVMACAKGAVYGFLQSARPVGLVEGVGSVLALRPSSVAQPRPMIKSPQPGDQLDDYRIDDVVARSGMASVFRGTDLSYGAARLQLRFRIPRWSAIRSSSTAFTARPRSAGGSITGRSQSVPRGRCQPGLFGDGVGGGPSAAPTARRTEEALP